MNTFRWGAPRGGALVAGLVVVALACLMGGRAQQDAAPAHDHIQECSPDRRPSPQKPEAVTSVLLGQGIFDMANPPPVPVLPSRRAQSDFVPRRHRTRPGQRVSTAGGVGGGASAEWEGLAREYQLRTSPHAIGGGFWGAQDTWRPPDEALVVGPHPTDPGLVYVVHAINKVVGVFVATKDGRKVADVTEIELTQMLPPAGVPNGEYAGPFDPIGFYDHERQRYVLAWTSAADLNYNETVLPNPAPPMMWFAVTQTADPMGKWVVSALDSRPPQETGARCDQGDINYLSDYPQATYDSHGVYTTWLCFCGDTNLGNVIYAYPKDSLYQLSSGVTAAVWTVSGAWNASVPGPHGAIDTIPQPALPQAAADVPRPPLFVGKQDRSTLTVGSLLDTQRLKSMTSVNTAPRLVATAFSWGVPLPNEDFTTTPQQSMPQPLTNFTIDSGDTNIDGERRSYGAMQSNGRLYLTQSVYWSVGGQPVTAIYWAFVDPWGASPDLCQLRRTAQGIISSKAGLSVAFPVIAATRHGGAQVAHVLTGSAEADFPRNLGLPYPGAAVTQIKARGHTAFAKEIQVIRTGEGSLSDPRLAYQPGPLRWGDYSAVSVLGDRMWVAINVAKLTGPRNTTAPSAQWGSWISALRL